MRKIPATCCLFLLFVVASCDDTGTVSDDMPDAAPESACSSPWDCAHAIAWECPAQGCPAWQPALLDYDRLYLDQWAAALYSSTDEQRFRLAPVTMLQDGQCVHITLPEQYKAANDIAVVCLAPSLISGRVTHATDTSAVWHFTAPLQ